MRLTELGLYQDKALESARRLADIVNQGTASPWAAMFDIPEDVLAQGEGAVKAWASSLQKDVTDLTRPDLINWDAFVANFESQADREAAQALTIDIAVGKLSDAGLLTGSIEDKKKEVAKMLGLEMPEMTLKTLFEADAGAGDKIRKEIYGDEDALTLAIQFTADGKVGTDMLPPGLKKLLGADEAEGEAGKDAETEAQNKILELAFRPKLLAPDSWDVWADEQFGSEKPGMMFHPRLSKIEDTDAWVSDQMGDTQPEIMFHPRLSIEDDTVDDMSSAMIKAMSRNSDPMINAGEHIGDYLLTGMDKAIDDGADSFFERMAKRIIPEIMYLLPLVGGKTPLP